MISIESFYARLQESLLPTRDDGPRGLQALLNHRLRQSLGQHQNQLGATIRVVLCCTSVVLLPFFCDHESAVLPGEPLLRRTLSLHMHERWRQRIAAQYNLKGLSREGLDPYLAHQFKTAGVSSRSSMRPRDRRSTKQRKESYARFKQYAVRVTDHNRSRCRRSA